MHRFDILLSLCLKIQRRLQFYSMSFFFHKIHKIRIQIRNLHSLTHLIKLSIDRLAPLTIFLYILSTFHIHSSPYIYSSPYILLRK